MIIHVYIYIQPIWPYDIISLLHTYMYLQEMNGYTTHSYYLHRYMDNSEKKTKT